MRTSFDFDDLQDRGPPLSVFAATLVDRAGDPVAAPSALAGRQDAPLANQQVERPLAGANLDLRPHRPACDQCNDLKTL